jgi:diguanylate cyclase (GGDEF)-like protein
MTAPDETNPLPPGLPAAHADEIDNAGASGPREARSYDFRAQQMAALYEIGLSITAQLDLKAILYSLYDHVQELLSPEVFYIAIYDENTHLIEFPLFYDQGNHRPMPPRDVRQTPGVTGAVILGKQTLVIKDTLDIPETSQYQFIRTGGKPIRTYVGVAMISHNRTIGVISMQKYLPDAFTQEEIRLLETIATQAAIAIENSQLFESLQKELEQHRAAQVALEEANTQLKAQNQQNEALRLELQEQAIRDPLTGLFNRRYLKETLDREVARAKRDGSAIGIIIMDIDEFKNVNDTFGHTAGDRFLQAMGELLKGNTRSGDIVCRYGGEEFVIVMPGASLHIAYERAELLRNKVDRLYASYENELLHATISLGVAAYPVHGSDSDDLLIRADRALYQSKQEGRNRTRAYHSATKPFPSNG